MGGVSTIGLIVFLAVLWGVTLAVDGTGIGEAGGVLLALMLAVVALPSIWVVQLVGGLVGFTLTDMEALAVFGWVVVAVFVVIAAIYGVLAVAMGFAGRFRTARALLAAGVLVLALPYWGWLMMRAVNMPV